MAILGYDINNKEVTVPKSKIRDYRTNTIVESDTDLSKMVHYIDGRRWTIDYFNQLVGEDDLAVSLDEGVPDSSVSYELINDLDLIVETDLSIASPSDVTGTSLITVKIKPQVGDLFRAKLDARWALFKITETINEHYNLNPVYKVNYVLDSYLDNDDSRYLDLLTKTVRVFHYDRDYIYNNTSPLVLSDTLNNRKYLDSKLKELTTYYFKTFVDEEKNILTIPNQEYILVDPYLEEFVFRLTESNHLPGLDLPNRVNSESEYYNTIYEVLLSKNKSRLSSILKSFKVVYTSNDYAFPIARSAYYQGAMGIVTFTEERGIDDIELTTEEQVEVYPNALGDTYLFSLDFYNSELSDNALEQLVQSYIDNEAINVAPLKEILDSLYNQTKFNQYYYIPVLLMLIIYVLRSNYETK